MNKKIQKNVASLPEYCFEDRLRKVRMLSGLSQEKLAEKLEKSVKTIARYESNEATPTLKELETICELFNVSADYLIFGVHSDDSTADDIMLTNLLKQCPEAQKESLITIVRAFVESHNA